MCSLFKKPKVVSAPATQAEPGVLRNPYLDGLDAVVRARSGGVRSLTIRKGVGGATAPNPVRPNPTAPTIPTTPGMGGGSGGSGGGGLIGTPGLTDNHLALMAKTISTKA